MPFEPKPIDPKAYEALDRIVAHTEAMRAAEVTRKEEAEKRAAAIVEARGYGLSLDAIAERLGVSRERVRQMAVKTADPVRANEEGPGPKANRLKPLR
jgi:DNA-directed RNA polymerase sigma subunit (sigma70/sigma32)